jgi:hypothetical protein
MRWRHLYLIEIIVSVMIALGASFVKTVDFRNIHLYLVLSVGPQFHFVLVVLVGLLKTPRVLFAAYLLLLQLKIYVRL